MIPRYIKPLSLWAVAFVVVAVVSAQNTPIRNRPYWPISIYTLSTKGTSHSHIVVSGRVKYTRIEDDGDLHMFIYNPPDTLHYIIGECIPELMCPRPKNNDSVTVQGIFRIDSEHHWPEVHPIEKLVILP